MCADVPDGGVLLDSMEGGMGNVVARSHTLVGLGNHKERFMCTKQCFFGMVLVHRRVVLGTW